MNSFKEAYKEAVKKLPMPDINIESVLNESRHKRVMITRLHRNCLSAALAVCLFLLCGAGTVTGVNYMKSVIKVNENGFTTADERTALLHDNREDIEVGYGMEDRAAAQEAGAPEQAKQEELETEILSRTDYGTLEEMRQANQELILAMPDLELLGNTTESQKYTVLGDSVFARLHVTEEKQFSVKQHNYEDSLGHASSTVYEGGVCNERTYTTGQEFTYTVIDSIREAEEPIRIHAAIAVNHYELFIDFTGYTEEEAYRILESIDLTVYF